MNGQEPAVQITPGKLRGITHSAPPENLDVNKYHLLWALERRRSRPQPRGDWAVAALSLFVGFLFPILTADFRKAFGVAANVWEAFAMLGALASGVAAARFYLRWRHITKKYPELTPEQEVQEIIRQMDDDKARAREAANEAAT